MLAALGLLTAGSAPVAAVVDAADYVVWRFSSPGPRGVGLIHDGTSNTIMFAETVGLKPNATYRFVGSSAKCGDAHLAANVVWVRNLQVNSKGAAFTNTTFDDEALTPGLRSIRLFRGSGQVDCAKPFPYQSDGGGGEPADGYAMLSAYGARLSVFVDLGRSGDKMTAVGHGFIASHGYRLVGSTVACPSQPSAGTTLFEKSGTTTARGILWRHDGGEIANSEPPKSIQLFNGSNRVACVTTTRLPAVQ